MARDQRKKARNTGNPWVSMVDRIRGGRSAVDWDAMVEEAESKEEMERLGLDEQAYEEYKRMPPRPSSEPYLIPDEYSNPFDPHRFIQSPAQRDYDERLRELQQQSRQRAKARAAEERAAERRRIRGEDYGPRVSDGEQAPETEPQPQQPQQAPSPAGGQTPNLENGEQQKKEETKAPPLKRKEAPSRASVSTDANGNVIVNGARAGADVRRHVQSAQKDAVMADAVQAAEARRDAQAEASLGNRRREQMRMFGNLELDKSLDDYKAAREARIAANYKKRADARYAAGKLSNEDDWKNLGREGSNWRDADKRAEGIKALQDRMTKMADTTSVDEKGNYTNTFYANDPKRQRDLAALRKLVDKGVADGTITDKQLDAVTAKLDKWDQSAAAAGERRAGAEKARRAERVRQLRQEYGLTDPSFTDPMVEQFHKENQEQARRQILQDMDVAPAQGGSEGRADRMARYADNWDKLLKAGLDPQATFSKAMAHPINQRAFMSGVRSIDRDDPERADKIDQLRRRFIVNQAMSDAGLDDKRIKAGGADTGSPVQRFANYAADMARDLPGSQSATALTNAGVIRPVDAGGRQLPSIVEAQRARDEAQSNPDEDRLVAAYTRREQAIRSAKAGDGSLPDGSSIAVSGSGEVARYAPDGTYLGSTAPDGVTRINPVPGLTLRRKDETQQAAKGGDALRPRRRR